MDRTKAELAQPAVADLGVTKGERHSHFVQRLNHIALDEQAMTVKWEAAAAERDAQLRQSSYGLFNPAHEAPPALPPRRSKKDLKDSSASSFKTS